MENNILVLGGGISGLAAGYVLNAPVVSTDIGGQNVGKFPLGPRYIHSTKETKIFVSSLGLSDEDKTVKVGYYYNHKYHTKIPKYFVYEYNVKTRETFNVPSNIREGSFKALKTSFSELIKKLEPKVKIIKDTIVKISGNTMFGLNGSYTFKKLISTISLPKLCELYGIRKTFNYIPIGYLFSDFNESFFFTETFGDFDYVYFPEIKYSYYRITKAENGFVYEFAASQKIKYQYPKNVIWQEYGKILPTSSISSPRSDVILLGRFGKWKDDCLFQDVLKDIKKLLSAKEVVQDVQGVQIA
jgi:hypothetical protein